MGHQAEGPFPIDPSTVHSVVVSHAHLDHVGWLPRLVAEGFTGPVLSTPATAELAAIVLRDAAHLQEEDARYAADKGYSRHHPPLPLYDAAAAEKAIALFQPVHVGVSTALPGGIRLGLRRAGHILGSASVELTAGGRTILVSGDLGRPDHPLLLPPQSPCTAHALVVESTYGRRTRPARDLDRIGEAIRAALRRGGSVLIPAFAVDRTEVVLMALRELMAARTVPEVPVYLDSPMALAALAVYRRACSTGTAEIRPRAGYDPFHLDSLRLAASVEESIALNHPHEPCIIISAAGMATGGRVVHHLAALAPESRNLILLAGFQVAGTRGRALLDGATTIKAHGRYIPVRAQVLGVDDLSCHADAREILTWLASIPEPPDTCYVVHGEPAASAALAARIHDELGWCAVVPQPGEGVRA